MNGIIENYYTVLLYSKYSEFSKNLIKQIENSSFDFVNKKNLSTVCIDNDEIRSRILASNNMDIKNVPCILIIYEDGVVEKYEGDDAFKWVEDSILKNQEQSPITQPMGQQLMGQQQMGQQQMGQQPMVQQQMLQQQMLQQPIAQQPIAQQPMVQQPMVQQPMIQQQYQQPMVQQPMGQQPMVQQSMGQQQMGQQQYQQPIGQQQYQQPMVQQPQYETQPQIQTERHRRMPPQREVPETRTRPVKKRTQEYAEMEATPIEDLNSEDEELYDNVDNQDIFPPKQVSLRSGVGSYDLNNDFGKKAETKITRGIKSTEPSAKTGRKGKVDVMSAALEMQKMREKEGDVIPKPTFA